MTAGGKFGRIYVRPTLFVVVAITTMKMPVCIIATPSITAPNGADLFLLMIPHILSLAV